MAERLDNRFSNLRVLLEDGYGKVLVGEDSDSGIPVVVDLLAIDGDVSDAEEMAFRQQVSALIEAGHPALPVLVEADHGENGYAVVWSHEGFVPLRMKMDGEEGFNLAQALDVVYQLADLLGSTGEEGHLHLDFSPNSIWVGESGEGLAVRVYRYGLRHLFPKYTPGFRGGTFWGTAEYMAPELCSGKEADIRADLYSAGIMLIEMLTGEPPFKSANPRTTLKRQIYEKPLPLRLAKPDLPGVQKLDEILAMVLAKAPTKRIESPGLLQEQLESYRAEFLPDFQWTLSGMDAAEDTASLGTEYHAPVVDPPAEAEEPEEVAAAEEPTQASQPEEAVQAEDGGASEPVAEQKSADEGDGVVTLVLGGADAPGPADSAEEQAPEAEAAADDDEVDTAVDHPAMDDESEDEIETNVEIAAAEDPDEPAETQPISDKSVKTTTIPKAVPSEIIERGVGSVGAPLAEEDVPGAKEPSEDLSEWFSQPADAIEPEEPSFHANVKKDTHYFIIFVGGVALLLGVAMYFLMDRAPEVDRTRVSYTPVAALGGSTGAGGFENNDEAAEEEEAPEDEEPEAKEEAALAEADAGDESVEADADGTEEVMADEEALEEEEEVLEEEEVAEEEEEEEPSELEAAEKLNEGGAAEKNGDDAMEEDRFGDAVRFYEAALASAPSSASVGAKLLKAKSELQAKQKDDARAAEQAAEREAQLEQRREDLAAQRSARKVERREKADARRLAREQAKEDRRVAREEAKERRRIKAEERAVKKAEADAKKKAAADMKKKAAADAKKKAAADAKKNAETKKAADKRAQEAAAKKAEEAKAAAKEAEKTKKKDSKAQAASELKKAMKAMKAKDYSGAKKAVKKAKDLGASEIMVKKILKMIAAKQKN